MASLLLSLRPTPGLSEASLDLTPQHALHPLCTRVMFPRSHPTSEPPALCEGMRLAGSPAVKCQLPWARPHALCDSHLWPLGSLSPG